MEHFFCCLRENDLVDLLRSPENLNDVNGSWRIFKDLALVFGAHLFVYIIIVLSWSFDGES